MKPIGSINATCNSAFVFKGKPGEFNATTRHLAKLVHLRGGKIGDTLQANFGGMSKAGMNNYIVSDGGDAETGGIWVERVW